MTNIKTIKVIISITNGTHNILFKVYKIKITFFNFEYKRFFSLAQSMG